MIPENRKLVIIGGGTFSHIRSHLALAAPAFGATARKIYNFVNKDSRFDKMDVNVYLTKMATGATVRRKHGSKISTQLSRLWNRLGESEFFESIEQNSLVTTEDVRQLTESLVADKAVKIIFFNAAICDFDGEIDEVPSGKYSPRLKTADGETAVVLSPARKIIGSIRKERKDILLVGFKTTTGATEDEQYIAGLNLLKKNSANLVLANDTKTRVNMIITPEEARYHVTTDRDEVLRQLIDIVWHRSQMTFTRSTVVGGDPVPWNSEEVFPALRTVVDYCIAKNAYKPFNNATVGHFACKLGPTTFLTSIRKSNFNDLDKIGLVKVETDGEDSVIAYGAKPSVGGQSQRIVFDEHQEYDCIVHFHCPIREGSQVPLVSQRPNECGSMSCGKATSGGLQKFGNLSAVMLDNHGPNIVFHHTINPQEVIDFIETNFLLEEKTGGKVTLR